MDTGTGRSVGIGLSVLWYRVIVQRKHTEWFLETSRRGSADRSKVKSNCLRDVQSEFHVFPDKVAKSEDISASALKLETG